MLSVCVCIVRDPLVHDDNLKNGEVKRVYKTHHSVSYAIMYGVQNLVTVVATPLCIEMSHYIHNLIIYSNSLL